MWVSEHLFALPYLMARLSLPLLVVGLLLAGCREAEQAPGGVGHEAPRVVALGASVAETVFALGAQDELVARDASALYPAEVLSIPDVGYFRMIAAEGVLSMNPTLVLADPNAGPPTALAQIEQAGVEVLRLPGGPSPDSAAAQVRAIAEALGREAEGAAIVDAMEADLAEVRRLVDATDERPRVLFVLDQEGRGRVMLGGSGTNADVLIRLAGGENAFGEAQGYQMLSAEALVEARPQVLFMLARTAENLGGVAAFLQRPEVAITPAAREGRVIVLPDPALSFGPSLGRFALDFARQLHASEVASP